MANGKEASRIISPVPIQIVIEYNEMTGQANFKVSKDLPFPVIVAIFSQLQLGFIRDAMAAGQQMPPAQT